LGLQEFLARFPKLGVAAPDDPRAIGAVLDAILVIPAVTVTGWHLYELSRRPESKERTIAILDEVSFVATYAARLLYTGAVTVAVNNLYALVPLAVAQLAHGGLQFAEAGVEFAVS